MTRRKYHKPKGTPSIDRLLATNDGPQTKTYGRASKAWCYIHDAEHSYADCAVNVATGKAETDE